MEMIHELHEALRAGDADKYKQLHLSQSDHELFFEVQVDLNDAIQRRTYLSAVKKVLPKNFLTDFKFSDNQLNLSNVGGLYPEKMKKLFMTVLMCAIEESDQKTLDILHAIEPKSSATIGASLDQYGHSLLVKKEFKKGIQVYDLAIQFASPGKSVYANATYAIQHNNTGLPIDKTRNEKWLEICLPHAPQNPAIFFNAACIFLEHQDVEKVIDNIQRAIHYGNPKDFRRWREMVKDQRFDGIRDRIEAIFNTPPIGVNPNALWSEENCEWFYGEKDQNGGFQGLVKYWRPGGTLSAQRDYVDGELTGTFTRFHESGEVSHQSQLKGEKPSGVETRFRSEAFTSEKAFVEPAPIHSVQTHWVDGTYFEIFRDINNTLLTPLGDPAPERPVAVPAGAFFLYGRWIWGYEKDGYKVGIWQYFSTEGFFLREEFYDDEGTYVYTIQSSDQNDVAFEKGCFDERDLSTENWIGLVTLLDENRNEIGVFDSTGADRVEDPALLQWIKEVRSVDWGSLESTYENSIAIAQHLIRFAVEEDIQSRDDALVELYSYVCYQDGYFCSEGVTNESSAYTIPLLIRLSGMSTFKDVRLGSLTLVEHMSLMPRLDYDEDPLIPCVRALSESAEELIALYSKSEDPEYGIAILNCLAGAFQNSDLVVSFLKEPALNNEEYAVRIVALGNHKAIPPEVFLSVDSMPNILKLAVLYGSALWWDGPGVSNRLRLLREVMEDKDVRKSFYKFPCVNIALSDGGSFTPSIEKYCGGQTDE